MADRYIVDFLAGLFENHGISCTVEDDWVVPNAELPALRAYWYPGESSGRLDVQILVSDGVIIEESFAGVGRDEPGLRDALVNFTQCCFHVLLAALWGSVEESQVTVEEWTVDEKSCSVYVGNFQTRSSEGITPHIPEDLFARIESSIKLEKVEAGLHWFRFFFCNLSGSFTFEALKDNEVWDAGVDCLQSNSWAKSEGYYSVRLFVVLRALGS